MPLDPNKFMTLEEVTEVVMDLRHRCKRSNTSRLNRTIFRLSCCYGLRRIEISGLNIGDVILNGPKPLIRVRKDITKGLHKKSEANPEGKDRRRARFVDLSWDSQSLDDIRDWLKFRRGMTKDPHEPFVCSLRSGSVGKRLSRDLIALKWRTAIRCLGPDRVEQLSIHAGRHTAISHALAAGRTLVEVRDWAGHRSIGTTNEYLHAVAANRYVPDMFPMEEE